MIRNYLTTAWRIISRNKIYSSINIIGLTIGLCACMLVATVVIDDLSYDKQWEHRNDLYRIVSVNKMGEGLNERFASAFAGLTNKLRTDYPEVKAAGILNVRDERLKPDNSNDPNGINIAVLSADTAVWQMLDIHILKGNPRRYIEGTTNIVLTKSLSNRFFPDGNAVGKIIHDVPTYSAKPADYLITGIIDDIPSNSIFRSEAIVLQKRRNEQLTKEGYGTYSPNNFILLNPGTDVAKFTAKINKWYAVFVTGKTHYQYEFQPLTDVYLKSDFAQNQAVKGEFRNIYIFSGVALLLLIIACVNFINLSTARAIHRVKETGVRVILGASRKQVIMQFLSESVLFFLIATLLATLIYGLFLPLVEKYVGHTLTQVFISKYQLFAIVYSTIAVISLLTGFYPAWIISGFKPADTLKGKLYSGNMGGSHFVRKCLVVLQFSISIIVLVALIVVQQQVSYMKHKDIGFNKNSLLDIGFISWDRKGTSFKNELLKQPGVESVSITPWTPTSPGYMTREVDDPNHAGNKLKIWYINGDIDLAKTLGLRLENGRFLNSSFSTDMMNQDSLMGMDAAQYKTAANKQSSLITSYTAKLLQVKKLNIPIAGALTSPVGIVADFSSESLKNPMEPTIILAENTIEYGGMLVRTQAGKEKQVADYINKIWRQYYPEKLLDIQWVDDMIAKQYDKESRLQQLFAFFSGLSMFLAAFGIFGLIVQVTSLRTKEIGIRKVLGASVQSIMGLFSIDFLKLVMVAIIVASPAAWWLMNKWLNDFANRITINWQVFALAGITALITALAAISFQAVKAATANPVKSLRTE